MADIFVLNGDIVWDNDDMAFVTGDDDIKQQAYLRSIADEGESVFYPLYGSKLFLSLGKSDSRANQSYVEAAAREALLKVKGITEVLHIEFKKGSEDAESLSSFFLSAKYKTESGKITISEFSFHV